MRWPGHIPAGKVDSVTVLSTVDLLPTFSELAVKRLPADYQPDGESFAGMFRSEPFKRSKPLLWEWRLPYAGDDPYRQNSWVTMAVREEKWKLLADQDRKRIKLYDISRDPFEQQNLAGRTPKKVQDLV